jgi:thiol:disulfide interchange protein
MILIRLLTVFLMLIVTASASAQGDDAQPMVDASLVSDYASVAPGETVHIALHQDITPGWHTYWRNPGDSGETTVVELTLPQGWRAGEMIWPAPKAYPVGPLTNYGYSNQVSLPIPVEVPDDAPEGPVTITAQASWLVCEDICIPESALLELQLNVGPSEVDRLGQPLIQRALDAAPTQAPDRFEAGLAASDDGLTLTLSGEAFSGGAEQVRNLAFFPYESGIIDHAAEQRVAYGDGTVRVDVAGGWLTRNGVSDPVTGVVVYQVNSNGLWLQAAMEFTAQPGASVNALEAASSPTMPELDLDIAPDLAVPKTLGFVQAALFALLGGLILNLMPCVFPILSMKALTLVEKRGAARGEARQLGLIFAAGVIGTFVALGVLLLVLRMVGLPGLWGAQLQVPVIVVSLALLMFLIGLNFLGVFEIGTSLQKVGGQVKDSGRGGAFLTGVLAVFVAAPCLAPFMTGALAFALAQPPAASLAIFAFLGVGLAAPFVLVTFVPGALNVLPRPGPWMVRFRQLLAFPMFGAAIWLVWVLVSQVGPIGVVWAMAALLAAGFVVWTLSMKGLAARASAVAGLLLTVGAIVMTARLEPVDMRSPGQGAWAQWSPEAVAQARASGQPVFVDFTAAWCVTCQINKLGALSDRDVKAVFQAENVALLRADFTNHDPLIAQELAQHGSAGVPLYLMYPAGSGAPEILPPLLTDTLVIEAVERSVRGEP